MFGSNLKLRGRILLGYGVPLLLTFISMAAVILNAKKVEEQALLADRGWLLVQKTDRLELLLHKRQALVRNYFLTKDEVFWKDYEESVSDYNALMKQADEFTVFSVPEQKKRLEEVKALGSEIYQANVELRDLIRSGNINEALKRFSGGNILPLVEKTSEIFRDLNQTEDQLQEQRKKEGQIAMQWLIITAMVGTISAAILAIAIGFWLASRIAQQINEIASSIAASSTEIAATVEQHERVAAQQATAANETTVTMDELGVSSRRSAEQAESAAMSAHQALALVGGAFQDSVSRNDSNLKQKVGQIAEQILCLSEQTSQIGSISNLVSDLANQTNMLALNAAVEAVRAGEHGKGFGVVAGEIRKLADQSRKSAEQINSLVTDIQNSTNSTIMVTDEGTKTVENIIAAISNINLNSQQISLTAKEQSVAIQQVVAAMNMLNQGAAETASGISQTKVSTHQLSESSQKLKAVV